MNKVGKKCVLSYVIGIMLFLSGCGGQSHRGVPQFEVPGRNLYLYRTPAGTSFIGHYGVEYLSAYETISVTKGPKKEDRSNLEGFMARGKGVVKTLSIKDWGLKASGLIVEADKHPVFHEKSIGYTIGGFIGGSGFVSIPETGMTVERDRIEMNPSRTPYGTAGGTSNDLIRKIEELQVTPALYGLNDEGDKIKLYRIPEEQGYLSNHVFFDGRTGKIHITPNDKY